MKVVLLLWAILAVATAEVCIRDDSNGQPLCEDVEIELRFWRNNWDPTAYWECTGEGVGVARRCPSEGMFSTVTRGCVNWFEWEWTPTCMPPSRQPKTNV